MTEPSGRTFFPRRSTLATFRLAFALLVLLILALNCTSMNSISSSQVCPDSYEHQILNILAGPKASAMLSLVKTLKEEGVPVDGIGFQSHFIVGEVPTSMSTVMEQMTALGVEVRLSSQSVHCHLFS